MGMRQQPDASFPLAHHHKLRTQIGVPRQPDASSRGRRTTTLTSINNRSSPGYLNPAAEPPTGVFALRATPTGVQA
jgi:hypothetical protein